MCIGGYGGKGIGPQWACSYLQEEAIAKKIRKAYEAVLVEGKTLTRDLGGTAGTEQFADAIIGQFKT